MSNGPDFGGPSFYGSQPGDYGTIGPYGYGSHRGEYGLDTAHGIVGISQSLAYGTNSAPTRVDVVELAQAMAGRSPRPRRRRNLWRRRLVLTFIIAAAVIGTTPAPVSPGHRHAAHRTQHVNRGAAR